MTIYLDLILLLNFCYDLLLLMTVAITLKRQTKFFKLLISAFLGALSIFFLFIDMNSYMLLILKIFVSILMCLIAYGFNSAKYSLLNISYLYMCSVILAGFLYLLDLEFSYAHSGLVFYFDGISVNFVLLIIIAPIILLVYIWQQKKLKTKQNLYYNVRIVFKNNQEVNVIGYLDTANKLKDPITSKNIIIVEKNVINELFIRSPIYVPYKAVNYQGLLKCFSPKYVEINKKIFKNYLLGIYEGKFNIDGVCCILNYKLMEDINV